MAQNNDLKLPLTAAADEHVDKAAQESVQQARQHKRAV